MQKLIIFIIGIIIILMKVSGMIIKKNMGFKTLFLILIENIILNHYMKI